MTKAVGKANPLPNNKYVRSTKRERERVLYWKARGWFAGRSAGSHGEYDVWAVSPNLDEAVFEQIKTKKGYHGKPKVTNFTEVPGKIKTYWLSWA